VPTFETPGRVALDLDVPAGAVSGATWDEPRVDVAGRPARGDDASAAAAAETRIELVERGGRYEISVSVPKQHGRRLFSRGPELDVKIRCPEDADVELSTHSADLDGNGRLGSVGVRSASGDVSVDAVGGAATVNTVSGDARLGETQGLASVTSVSGDVELDAVVAGARLNSVSGDLHVAARRGLALWIDAQSVSGSVTSDLDVGGGEGEGEGGAQVELRARSVSGDIRITRAAPIAG
jgi:DUF4097 and DUF4098 domain-containing protein YvlB